MKSLSKTIHKSLIECNNVNGDNAMLEVCLDNEGIFFQTFLNGKLQYQGEDSEEALTSYEGLKRIIEKV